MEVRCDKCQARYRIDDARVGPQGLAMRCGKCGNTFRATRRGAGPAASVQSPAAHPAATGAAPPAPRSPGPGAAAAPTAPATAKPPQAAAPAKPAPAVAPPAPVKPVPAAVPAAAAPRAPDSATVMFAAPANPAPPPAPPTRSAASSVPAAAKPVATGAKATGPARAAAVVAPLPDEAAGRTMMFNAGAALKAHPPARSSAGTVKPLSKPTDASGATLVFGASPALPQPPAPAKDDPAAGATVLFGGAPAALAETPLAEPDSTEAAGPAEAASSEQAAPEAGEEQISDGEVSPEAAPGRGPPRALVIGVAAALALVLVLAGVVFAVKKLGHRSPPRAALEVLAEAQAAAEKDTLASLAEAEALATAAIQGAPNARFPQAYAALAEIEIAWADALNDQAWYWGEKANRALAAGDDKKKAEAEAKAITLQDAAKARLKTAFEAAAAGNKMDPKSADVALALADYYRAAHSRVNLNRELKRAGVLKADEARIAFVQGADLAAQDEATARAAEKLRTALGASPRSARIRFRIAQAYLAARQDAEAKKELLATLEVSPQHERARMAMELLAPAAPAATEGKRE
jgi:predicted Zn finger-like uncharacterized protein